MNANHCPVFTQLGSSLSSSSVLPTLCLLFPDFPPPFGLVFASLTLLSLYPVACMLLPSSVCHWSARPPFSRVPPGHVCAGKQCDISAFPGCVLLFPTFYFCAHRGPHCTWPLFFFPLGQKVPNMNSPSLPSSAQPLALGTSGCWVTISACTSTGPVSQGCYPL